MKHRSLDFEKRAHKDSMQRLTELNISFDERTSIKFTISLLSAAVF